MEQFGFDVSLDDEPQEVVEDEVPEEVETRCKLGNLWQLGNHRLICGDSTDPAVIDRLMDGVKADMLFTSPPYSDMREYNGGKDLSVSNVSNFISAYRPYVDYQCVNLGIQRKNHEIVQYWDEYIAKAKECGYKLLAWNVWDKTKCGSIGNQSAFFPIRHEWIFVFGTEFFEINNTWKKADGSIKSGSKARRVRQADGTMKVSSTGDLSNPYKQMESVVQILPEQGEIIKKHPATFPVQLPAEYIKAMTNEGDSVIEPFGGSGSTLIACEQLNRKCYMCEIDPRYCDVIIERWENLTGEKAVLISE
jgi:DNA modification methylase